MEVLRGGGGFKGCGDGGMSLYCRAGGEVWGASTCSSLEGSRPRWLLSWKKISAKQGKGWHLKRCGGGLG